MRPRSADRLAKLFKLEERRGLRLMAMVRIGVTLVVLAWQALASPLPDLAYLYNLGVIALFIATGFLHLLAARPTAASLLPIYGLVALDALLMLFFFTLPNPLVLEPVPLYMIYRWDAFHWLYLLIIQAAMALRWTLVVWAGLLVVGVRISQAWIVLTFSDAYSEASLASHANGAMLAAFRDVAFVPISNRIGETIAVLGVTAALAFVVTRSRRLVLEYGTAERARGALARYFSPNVVDTLSAHTDGWRTPQRREIVVLFADIKGFTGLCASLTPEQTTALLRRYHGLLASAVFDHGGTLDKFLGDGMLATFNTPEPTARPASDALACARDILAAGDAWNAERAASGLPSVRFSLGLHWGPAVLGDVGDERRLEFTVIGDAVNIASRLEQATRTHDRSMIVSDALVGRARSEGADVGDLVALGGQELRGREGVVEVWGI